MPTGPFPQRPNGSGTAAAAAPARQNSAKAQTEESRNALVLDLREQYLSGDYQVNASKLSKKIVDAHLEHQS